MGTYEGTLCSNREKPSKMDKQAAVRELSANHNEGGRSKDAGSSKLYDV